MLPLKFRSVVTKRRLAFVLSGIWLLSLSMAPIVWFTSSKSLNIIMLFWDSFLVLIYICTYLYIIVAVQRRRRQFTNQNNTTTSRGLNLKVPFLLVLTLICFYFIPDLVIVAGATKLHIYLNLLFNFNYISDALIFLFGLPECKKRLKKICCITRIESSTRANTVNSVNNGNVTCSTV